MALLLRDDPDRVGYALLRCDPERAGPLSLSIQFLDRTFLAPDGRRSRERHLFAATAHPSPGLYDLGPDVTVHVPEDEVVTLADEAGLPLGTVAWEGIRPPPGDQRGALVGAQRVATTPLSSAPHAAAESDAVQMPDRSARDASEALPRQSRFPDHPIRRARTARLAMACLSGLLAVAGWTVLVLSGRIGWEIDHPLLSFAATAGEGMSAEQQAARLHPLWYAVPLVPLVSAPFVIDPPPAWLALTQEGTGAGFLLHVALSPADGRGPSGDQRFGVPIRFPIGGTGAGLAVEVTLHLTPPPPRPALPPPPAAPPAAPPVASAVDDALCDRSAGNRLDPDHPAGGGSVDEVFDLSPEAVEAGIAACDLRTDRTGPDRRLLVQRGRLLAARALLRAAAGTPAAARADMDAAVATWRAGSARGSGFADSLLGSYLFGSFNRPGITFVQADDAAAALSWKRGMERGSVVAQRNYAAQLLGGRGLAAAPTEALGLLRTALARGDERAAGVLGVALYTGFPAGVPLDKAEGWTLVTRAQCVDKASGDLLAAEIARGARPASDRHACP